MERHRGVTSESPSPRPDPTASSSARLRCKATSFAPIQQGQGAEHEIRWRAVQQGLCTPSKLHGGSAEECHARLADEVHADALLLRGMVVGLVGVLHVVDLTVDLFEEVEAMEEDLPTERRVGLGSE